MKALIVEDEPLVAKDLNKLIADADPSIEVIGTEGVTLRVKKIQS